MVFSSSGKIFSSYLVLNSCEVKVGRKFLRVDFIMLLMIEFDVILSMDWLSMHGALLDYCGKKVLFATPNHHVAVSRIV